MELLTCTDCGFPLTMEIREIRCFDIAEDGKHLLRCVEGGFTDSYRYEEEIRCPHCGKEFHENMDWRWENGRITLKQKRLF